MGKQPSNLIPPPAEVRSVAPELQLQFLFDETDAKRQKIRELKRYVSDQIDQDPEYVKAKDDFAAATSRIKSAKGAASRDYGQELDDIERLTAEVKSANEQMSDMALVQLQKGEQVTVTKNGQTVHAQLRVKFVPVDPGEEGEENE